MLDIEKMADLIEMQIPRPCCRNLIKRCIRMAYQSGIKYGDLEFIDPNTLAKVLADVKQFVGNHGKTCGDEDCLVCRVACVPVNNLGLPRAITPAWERSLKWLFDALFTLRAREDIPPETREAADNSSAAIAWLVAQSRVAEELMDENMDLREQVELAARQLEEDEDETPGASGGLN
jgi:hypothetical protein